MQAQLILHFDINKTLILKDSSKGIESEEMLTSLLAEFTYGQWDNIHGRMSYTEYVERVLLPDDSKDPQRKMKRTRKTCEFLNWLQAVKHPLQQEVFEKRDMMKRKFTDPVTGELKFCVFQSFYKLIQHLQATNRRFVVSLRTFGDDLEEVVDEIGSHPLGIKITRKASFVNKELHLEGASTVKKAETIFETFLQSQEHFAIQDNWKEWNSDGGHARSGKPFFYDASGKWHDVSNLSLFFDDNFSGEERDILNPIEVSGKQVTGGELKGKMLFTVNPIEAVLDDDYYIKLVKHALTLTRA